MVARTVYREVIKHMAVSLEGDGFLSIAKSQRGEVFGRRFVDGLHLVEVVHHRTHGTQSCSFHVRCGTGLDVVRECINGSADFVWNSPHECETWIDILPSSNEWRWTVFDTSDARALAAEIVPRIREEGEAFLCTLASITQVRDLLIPCLVDTHPALSEVMELAIILKVLDDPRFEAAREILTKMRSTWPTDIAAGICLAKLDRYVVR